MNNKKWFLLVPAAAAAAAAGLPRGLDITRYTIADERIKSPIRIVLLSDLHDDSYGENMKGLEIPIRGENPDLILMPGDMAEEHRHQDHTLILLNQLKEIPMFYSTGNHEEYRWDLTDLKERFRKAGVTVLDEKSSVITIRGTELEIAGISCRHRESEFTPEQVNGLFTTDDFRILLSHRPNWVDLYRQINCDLIVSGHAHGGQWKIPGTSIGVAAPQQGFFPKWTEGMHDLGKAKLIISRGLVRHYHHIPRLYNNPELVVINLVPKEN